MKNLEFVFWGNINIHVYPLAEALSKKVHVAIIYDSSTFSNRKERMIAYIPSTTLRILDIANMDDSKLMQIVKQYTGEGTIHINTALKNDKSRFHKALNMLNNANRWYLISLPQEGFQFQGVKGFINRIKWFYL